jgi:hypothetical protein
MVFKIKYLDELTAETFVVLLNLYQGYFFFKIAIR